MPTYEYRCKDCGHTFDAYQSFTDDALTECPSCAGTVKKVFGNVGISFKGSGFYKTDSRGATANGKSSGADATSGTGSSGDTKTGTSSESGSSGSGGSSEKSSGSSSSSSSDKGSGSSTPASTPASSSS